MKDPEKIVYVKRYFTFDKVFKNSLIDQYPHSGCLVKDLSAKFPTASIKFGKGMIAYKADWKTSLKICSYLNRYFDCLEPLT